MPRHLPREKVVASAVLMEDRPAWSGVVRAPIVTLQRADDICRIPEHKDANISLAGGLSKIPAPLFHSRPSKQNKMLRRQKGFPDVCFESERGARPASDDLAFRKKKCTGGYACNHRSGICDGNRWMFVLW